MLFQKLSTKIILLLNRENNIIIIMLVEFIRRYFEIIKAK